MNTKQIVVFAVGVAVGFYLVPRLMAATSKVSVG